MKGLFLLVVTLLIGFTANAQTNVINIYNSKVTINNIVIQTNVVQQTNSTLSNKKLVVLPQEVVERLRWESALEQRRQYYLRKSYGK